MFNWLVFLGLLAQIPEKDTVLFLKSGRVFPYSDLLPGLVSADPQARIRSAWLLPDFTVKGESITLAGFRPDETRITLNGIPLTDPQTSELSLFLPSAMCGEALLERQSGSVAPNVNFAQRDARDRQLYINFNTTSPFFIPDAKNGQADLSVDVPLGEKLTVSADGALMRWQERPYYNLKSSSADIRTGLSAYTYAATATVVPSEGLCARIGYASSLNQRDIYSPEWFFNPLSSTASYTSANLLYFDFIYDKKAIDLRMTLSRYSGYLWRGGREGDEMPLFTGFVTQDTTSPHAALNTENPFGVEGLFYSQGTNPRITERSSVANCARASANFFAGDINELRGFLSFTGYDFISGSIHMEQTRILTDEFQYTPRFGDFYLADRLHLGESWIEPGLGFIYMETERKDTLIDDDTLDIKLSLMPRVTASTSLWDIDIYAGSDLAAGVLPYAWFLDNNGDTSRTDTILLFPKVKASPERAWRTWVTAQRRISGNWHMGFDLSSNVSYKTPGAKLIHSGDSLDTLSPAAGIYLDANGVCVTAMPWIGYYSEWGSLDLSYRFSSSKSTSQGVFEDYENLVNGASTTDTLDRTPFDSRHKIVLNTRFQTPVEFPFLFREWSFSPRAALASGFPEEEGQDNMPWWVWLEFSLGRTFTFGVFRPSVEVTLLNPFGWTGPVFGKVADPAHPSENDYPDRVYLGESKYHPSRDLNHDGYITAGEEVSAYKRALDFYEACTPGPIPARSLEVKLSFSF